MQILQDPVKIGIWAVVNFSTRVDMSYVSRQLINCGRHKGIVSHVQILASLSYFSSICAEVLIIYGICSILTSHKH